jgi:1,2-diacylglycerol 3-beta-galactosyltransferase
VKKIYYSILKNSGGHVSAARAIAAAMEELKVGPFEHKLGDLVVKVRTFWTNFAYSYSFLNEYFPWAWKAAYYATNDPKRVRKLYDICYPFLFARKIKKFLEEEKPDLILSMVGPPTQGIIRAIKKSGKTIPVITIALDPVSIHATWVDPRADVMIVATEEARETCLQFGMPPKKVRDIGFPIHPRFLQDYGSKEDLRREFDLDPDTFTVLLMGGGAGIGRVFEIATALNSSDLPVQLIVVAGFNKKLELRLLRKKFHFPIKVFGYTDRIPEIMAASDAMITKAGPGAIFEAIAKELPLILTGCIPGQEEGNVDYVEKNRLGIIAQEPEKIVNAVRHMQTTGTEEFKSNMRRIRNPAAVYEIAKLVASYLQ